MTKETLVITLRLLERVTLQGAEVPTFNGVVQAIQEEIRRLDTTPSEAKGK